MKKTDKAKTKKRARTKTKTARTTSAVHALHHPEKRERFYRAKRALRALRHAVWSPRAVIHSNRTHVPEGMLNEIPEQAMIEHWEALGELKSRGIEIRSTNAKNPKPHLLREIELDAPVSSHARHFASQHGLLIRERKSPLRSSLERIFG